MTQTQPAAKPRVLSGMMPTGTLTIGNYVGALSKWAETQDRYENFFFIADLHALSIPENVHPDQLRERIRENVALYLACGLDPERSVLFCQSHVPAHASLAWIYNCVTPVSWLERMTQYKVKAETGHPSAGLLTYPVLQAADIVLYRANYVPVGEDQRQHVELTRQVAGRFNHMFGETFVVPEPMIPPTGARIMALDDPTAKMSKSTAEVREGHAIRLLDPPKTIKRAIMRSVTDSGSQIRRDDLSPGLDNLITLYESLSGGTRTEVLDRFDGQGYGTLKKELVEVAVERVGEIQERYEDIRSDPSYVDKVLAEGAECASEIANDTLNRALNRVGLA